MAQKSKLYKVSNQEIIDEGNYDSWQLLKYELNGDITLSCEGKSISAHKEILYNASSYFRELIDKHDKEAKAIVIHFHNTSFVNLCLMLKYVYRGFACMTKDRIKGFNAFIEDLKLPSICDVIELNAKTPKNAERRSGKKKQGSSLPQKSDSIIDFDMKHEQNRKRQAEDQVEEPPMKRVHLMDFSCYLCDLTVATQEMLDMHCRNKHFPGYNSNINALKYEDYLSDIDLFE